MKTVEIAGKTYEVPGWGRYVAMDSDGTWWVYEHKPCVPRLRGLGWVADGHAAFVVQGSTAKACKQLVTHGKTCAFWTTTLREVA